MFEGGEAAGGTREAWSFGTMVDRLGGGMGEVVLGYFMLRAMGEGGGAGRGGWAWVRRGWCGEGEVLQSHSYSHSPRSSRYTSGLNKDVKLLKRLHYIRRGRVFY